MNLKPVALVALVVIGAAFFYKTSSKGEREYVASRLNISTLPSTTSVEECRDQDNPDNLPVRECLLQTTEDDLQVLLSGHEFREVNAPAGSMGRQAIPGNHLGVQSINVFFNPSSGKGSVEFYEPGV